MNHTQKPEMIVLDLKTFSTVKAKRPMMMT